jgi:hypothetical protein
MNRCPREMAPARWKAWGVLIAAAFAGFVGLLPTAGCSPSAAPPADSAPPAGVTSETPPAPAPPPPAVPVGLAAQMTDPGAPVAVTAAGKSIRGVVLRGKASDFAFNPASGALLAVEPDAGVVTLYPRAYLEGASPEVIGPVKVGQYPASIVCKRYRDKTYFVVGCMGESTLSVLDARTLAVVKVIKLGRQDSSSLCTADDPADPYIYYVSSAAPGDRISRVNLATSADEGALKLTGTRIPAVGTLAVSPDGRRLYTHPFRTGSTSDIDIYTPCEIDGPRGWRLGRHVVNVGPLTCPDPFNLTVAAGNVMFSADLVTRSSPLLYTPEAFFADRAVIVGTRPPPGLPKAKRYLVAASYNTLQVFGEMAIPLALEADAQGPPPKPSDDSRWDFRPLFRCFADAAGNRVLMACGSKALLVPLSDLAVTAEPLLGVRAQWPETVYVGESLRLPLEPLDTQATLELKEAPPGMKLLGHVLAWNPAVQQLGKHSLTLRVLIGSHERLQTHELNVTRRSITLGFAPDGLALSPSGKLAVAWASFYTNPDRGSGAPTAAARASRLALIDLQQGRVLADRTLSFSGTTAAVDEGGVYVGSGREPGLYRLHLKDLSEAARGSTLGNVVGITPVTETLLAVSRDEGVMLVTSADLKPADVPLGGVLDRIWPSGQWWVGPQLNQFAPGTFSRLQRLPDGWWVANCLITPDFSKAVLMANPMGLPTLPTPATTGVNYQPLGPWRLRLGNGRLYTETGRLLGEPNTLNDSTQILPSLPIAVTLVGNHPGGDPVASGQALLLSELVTGKAVEKIPVTVGPLPADPASRARTAFACFGNTVYVTVSNEIFVVPLDAAVLARFPAPFTLETPAEIAIISPEAPTRIPHKVRGGAGPVQFSLVGRRTGVSIDPATGTVTVDGPALVKEAAKAIESFVIGYAGSPGPKGLAPDGAPRRDPIQNLKERFQAMTGRPATGIPVCIPLRVAAMDKEEHTAVLSYEAILEVPETAIIKPPRK